MCPRALTLNSRVAVRRLLYQLSTSIAGNAPISIWQSSKTFRKTPDAWQNLIKSTGSAGLHLKKPLF
jgi:hypothetical protein